MYFLYLQLSLSIQSLHNGTHKILIVHLQGVTCIAVYLKDICSSGERRRREQRRERLHCYAAKTDRRTMSQGSGISQICLSASLHHHVKRNPIDLAVCRYFPVHRHPPLPIWRPTVLSSLPVKSTQPVAAFILHSIWQEWRLIWEWLHWAEEWIQHAYDNQHLFSHLWERIVPFIRNGKGRGKIPRLHT